MLDAEWVERNAARFDVFHIHFGFDAVTPARLSALAASLMANGKPLVYTVHDLRNPHHPDPYLHDSQIDVLVEAADELITITEGAADEIERRWGRRPVVLPHPHVVDEPWRSWPRYERDEFVVGVHVKSLRANMSPGHVIDVLAGLMQRLPGGRLRVDAHTDVFVPGAPNHDPSLVRSLVSRAERGELLLYVHDCFSDDELWKYFLHLDVSVLPYRFGTHSGWLEACYDLGTLVVAPQVGYLTEQRPCLTYRPGDGDSLRRSVLQAFNERPTWRASTRERDLDRDRLAAMHRQIYTRALCRWNW
jgi:glycosyltransferase involved in cell wall biosynthesis